MTSLTQLTNHVAAGCQLTADKQAMCFCDLVFVQPIYVRMYVYIYVCVYVLGICLQTSFSSLTLQTFIFMPYHHHRHHIHLIRLINV